MEMPELRPKQDCTTGWNSTFYMLKQFLESKDAIISTVAIVNAPVDALTQEEWEVVEEVCRVLEPFEQVTVEISGERYRVLEPFEQVTVEISGESYVTASKMILLFKGLQRITASRQREANVSTGHVTELMDTLCSSMDRKFHRMEYNHVLSETAALDPRFKKLAFSDARAIHEVIQITSAAGRDSPSSQLAQSPGQQEEEGGTAPTVSWLRHQGNRKKREGQPQQSAGSGTRATGRRGRDSHSSQLAQAPGQQEEEGGTAPAVS
ncbi:zinc finger BED domain-containing protein 4-like [Salvelinus alpinus]